MVNLTLIVPGTYYRKNHKLSIDYTLPFATPSSCFRTLNLLSIRGIYSLAISLARACKIPLLDGKHASQPMRLIFSLFRESYLQYC